MSRLPPRPGGEKPSPPKVPMGPPPEGVAPPVEAASSSGVTPGAAASPQPPEPDPAAVDQAADEPVDDETATSSPAPVPARVFTRTRGRRRGNEAAMVVGILGAGLGLLLLGGFIFAFSQLSGGNSESSGESGGRKQQTVVRHQLQNNKPARNQTRRTRDNAKKQTKAAPDAQRVEDEFDPDAQDPLAEIGETNASADGNRDFPTPGEDADNQLAGEGETDFPMPGGNHPDEQAVANGTDINKQGVDNTRDGHRPDQGQPIEQGDPAESQENDKATPGEPGKPAEKDKDDKPRLAPVKEELPADVDPEKFLAGRGLSRDGNFWLVSDEEEIEEQRSQVMRAAGRLKEAGKLVDKFPAAAIPQLKARLAAVQDEARILEEVEDKSEEEEELYRRLLAESRALARQIPAFEVESEKARARYDQARQDLLSTTEQGRAMAEQLDRKYENLSLDGLVNSAIEKTGGKLGPSSTLRQVATQFKRLLEMHGGDELE